MESVSLDEPESCFSSGIMAEQIKTRKYNTLIDDLERMNLSDKQPVISYDQVYASPWAASTADEDEYQRLHHKMKMWCQVAVKPAKDKQPSPDNMLLTLMRLILMFDPENVMDHLKQRDVCEQLNRNYKMMLYRYISHYYPKQAGDAKINDAMLISAYARQAAKILWFRLPI